VERRTSTAGTEVAGVADEAEVVDASGVLVVSLMVGSA
jgi:hypothetical protein